VHGGVERRAVQTEHRCVGNHFDLAVRDVIGQPREQALADLDAARGQDDVFDVPRDGVGRLGVERPPALEQRAEARLVARERPPLPPGSRPRDSWVDVDQHRQRALAQRAPDRGRLDGPATECEHCRPLVAQRRQRRLGLEHAELRLAPLLEQLRHRLAQRALELAVEVDEPPAEPVCHLDAERRLARAHEADEREVPL